jgi:hypothetical protein
MQWSMLNVVRGSEPFADAENPELSVVRPDKVGAPWDLSCKGDHNWVSKCV